MSVVYFITWMFRLRITVMKKYIYSNLVVILFLFSLPAFSQTESDTTLLGLPGDNLDLYAVLNLFQNSKTIEEFEKTLNLEKTQINNMDLDLDGKVDFIKVVTKKEDDDYTFILQIAVSKTETQDVAVILVSKDKNKKITMQIVGDEDLYGKKYIVELKETTTPAVTANPGYKGPDTTVVVSAPAKTTVVVVESTPIVQYVYSPAYVPYYPPYYYGFYPPYFAAFSVMAVGMYWGHHAAHHHHGYGGYHGNTTVIHNTNNFNNYNSNRNRSNTVNHNKANGNYNRGNNASTRPSTRPSTGASTRPSTRPSAGQQPSNRSQTPQSPVIRQNQPSNSDRRSSGTNQSNRQSNNSYSRPSSNGASRYSGGSRGGSSFGGGGSRGGGGGGRRR
jgi:uncharacterized membrane protein YgcG